ncbi:MAG: hypothetical protein ACOCVF_01230 [bacterium]
MNNRTIKIKISDLEIEHIIKCMSFYNLEHTPDNEEMRTYYRIKNILTYKK